MKVAKLSFITAVALGTLVAMAPVSRSQESKDESKPQRPPAGQRERRGGPPAGPAQFERIAERLKLTDEQKTKLRPIYREQAVKIRELRQDTSLTPEERREKVRALREEFLAKMKPILTTEQYDELKKPQERPPGRGPRPNRGGGPEGGGRAIEERTP